MFECIFMHLNEPKGTRPPRVQSKAAADIKPLAAVPSSAGEALERQRVKQPVVMC